MRLRCKLGIHKSYYVTQGLMTSVIRCDLCGLFRGVGHDLYGTTFPVDQAEWERKLTKRRANTKPKRKLAPNREDTNI